MTIEEKVVLVNPLGLHARAAGKIVKIAGNSLSRIEIVRPSKGKIADARSILELLSLGAKQGTSLVVRSTETSRVLEIVELIESGFGEI